jgi:hypothetical protein
VSRRIDGHGAGVRETADTPQRSDLVRGAAWAKVAGAVAAADVASAAITGNARTLTPQRYPPTGI